MPGAGARTEPLRACTGSERCIAVGASPRPRPMFHGPYGAGTSREAPVRRFSRPAFFGYAADSHSFRRASPQSRRARMSGRHTWVETTAPLARCANPRYGDRPREGERI